MFKKILTLAITVVTVFNLSCTKEVPTNTKPELCINRPASMFNADGSHIPYKYGQPIMLTVDVTDIEDEIITQERVLWTITTVEGGKKTMPLDKGQKLNYTKTIPSGVYELSAMYQDNGGLVGGITIHIIISDPIEKKVLVPTKKVIREYDGYVINDDNTVTDMSTGLTWMVEDDGHDKTFAEATSYAVNMTKKTGKPWSIPTLEQWNTISDFYKGGKNILDQPFSGLKVGSNYWTRTMHSNTVQGRNVLYSIDLSSIPGGGVTNLRVAHTIRFMDVPTFVILVNK